MAEIRPTGTRSCDELTALLQQLRVAAGVSYRELHRRVLRCRRAAGVPELPAYDTVYRCLQPGRIRLDPALVTDIVSALGAPEPRSWYDACCALALSEVAVEVDRLPPRRRLVGRVDALSRLESALAAEAPVGPVLITGMPGVGKTSLAVEAAYRRSVEREPLDVWFVEMNGFGSVGRPVAASAVVGPLLRRLGVHADRLAVRDSADRYAMLEQVLASRRVLLVLDNVRSEEQVRPLLPGPGSPSRILVTSRNLLRLGGTVLPLGVFSAAESATLLTDVLGARAPDQSVVVCRLAELSGHLPLALTLTAGRIAEDSDWQLTDHLDRQLDLQAAHRLDAGVEASLQLSYADLSEAEQRILRTLSQLPGPTFDDHSVAAVGQLEPSVAHTVLERLARCHLVTTTGQRHFGLHDLIRVYLVSRSLEADPPRFRRSALDRLYAYQRAGTAAALARPAADATRWLERERANLLAGAFHALDHGRTDHAAALSRQLFGFLIFNQYVDDAARLYERVAAATLGRDRADALLALGAVNGSAGRLESARGPLEQALALYEEAGEKAGVAKVVHNLGALCWELGDYDAAGDAYRRAAPLAAEIEGPAGLAMTVDNLGTLHARQGRYAEARACHEQALAIHRRLHDRVKEARTLNSLGLLALRQGGVAPARRLLDSALAIALSTKDPIGELVARSRLAELDSLAGHHDRAVAGLRRALAIGRDRSSTSEEMLEAHVALAAALRRGGRLAEARDAQHAAASRSREAGDPYWAARAVAETAALAWAVGDVDGAHTAWAAAAAELQRLGCPDLSDEP